METPPGTPKPASRNAIAHASRGNMMNERHLAFDPRAKRLAMKPVDPELLRNAVLFNASTGYVDPAVAHVFKGVIPKAPPKPPVAPFNWGAAAAGVSIGSAPTTRMPSPEQEESNSNEAASLPNTNPKGAKRSKPGQEGGYTRSKGGKRKQKTKKYRMKKLKRKTNRKH